MAKILRCLFFRYTNPLDHLSLSHPLNLTELNWTELRSASIKCLDPKNSENPVTIPPIYMYVRRATPRITYGAVKTIFVMMPGCQLRCNSSIIIFSDLDWKCSICSIEGTIFFQWKTFWSCQRWKDFPAKIISVILRKKKKQKRGGGKTEQ